MCLQGSEVGNNSTPGGTDSSAIAAIPEARFRRLYRSSNSAKTCDSSIFRSKLPARARATWGRGLGGAHRTAQSVRGVPAPRARAAGVDHRAGTVRRVLVAARPGDRLPARVPRVRPHAQGEDHGGARLDAVGSSDVKGVAEGTPDDATNESNLGDPS